MADAKILIVMSNGGVAAVHSTIPVEIVFQDYDVEEGSDFADDDNPSRQTIVFDPKEVAVVDRETLDRIISCDNEPDGSDIDLASFDYFVVQGIDDGFDQEFEAYSDAVMFASVNGKTEVLGMFMDNDNYRTLPLDLEDHIHDGVDLDGLG